MLQTMTAPAAEAQPRPILQLVGVRKTFGRFAAVESIDLDVREGEFLTIVGPSGSGKTTLLRMLAGMDTPSEGYITLRGELINDMPANRRPTCLVFQSLALFPHKSVGENITFPLKVKGVSAAARKARALELMKVVRLPPDYFDKNVMKCSGGERQRVALARAFAYDPQVLFFDEPLSALDYKLKKALEKELKDLHRETGKTFIYITHSLEEAMVMSDRIGVMRAGRLVQVGTPEEIYGAPVDRFVSEFVGEVNTIKVKRDGEEWRGVDVDGRFTLRPPADGAALGEAFVVVRPEYMRFLKEGDTADNRLTGTVYNEYSLGSRIQYQIRVGEKVMLVELSRARALPPGSDPVVTIGWDAADAFTLAG
ncbi:ABC transporter ATP-binding protein [Ancylobacter sp. 6x-1]|uniref:ABC transporter ATP-binding protein n=1 Tax=Ancylobacter crimeensis TaxID=2579147 RepID=A0ABT0DCX5_9HYPH|nr:ABC transporter ATP-binding protein [Ancylobacter crimeensis]MCK0197817.1 ABC transporter ATP-binding protein [Ancylobacter crimeensis]